MTLVLRTEQETRFWRKVSVAGVSECWPWLGSTDTDGYGLVCFDYKHYQAHRVAALLVNGEPLSDKPLACHKCDNPPCCNPRHLFWGSHSDNRLDASRKGRLPKTRSKRAPIRAVGVNTRNRKLTDEEINEIWLSPEKATVISRRLAICIRTVWVIRTGRRWRELTSRLPVGPRCAL